MNWSGWNSNWGTPPGTVPGDATYTDAVPKNPWDVMSQDELLVLWDAKKKALTAAKDDEMSMRKYIVSRAFPNASEGTNTLDLGNGYQLKAAVKFNYKLTDNKAVENAIDKIALVGNQGAFIAERLVSWTPNFLLTEYRVLQEEAKEGSQVAIDILKIVNDEMLTIDVAAPTLDIKEPKAKRK